LAEENRGLPAFAQGYAGQAADVTDRIDSAFVMSSEVETSLNQYQSEIPRLRWNDKIAVGFRKATLICLTRASAELALPRACVPVRAK